MSLEEISMTRKTQKPASTHVKEDKPSHQQASNSAQSVEPEDKSRDTQNPTDQRRSLNPNVHGSHSQSKPVPGQPAGQHATGSFTGESRKSGE
jgi:hypothetical protein